MPRRTVNLSGKFIIGATLFVIVPTIIVGAIGFSLGQNGITMHTTLHLQSVVALKQETMEHWLGAQAILTRTTVVSSLGTDDLSTLDTASAARLDRVMADLRASSSGAIQDVGLYQRTGLPVYLSVEGLPSIRELITVKGMPAFDTWIPNERSAAPRLWVANSLGADGILVTFLDLDELGRLFTPDPGLGDHGQTYLVIPGVGTITSSGLSPIAPAISAETAPQNRLILTSDASGTEFAQVSVTFPEHEWRIAAAIPAAEAFRDVADMRLLIALSMGVLWISGTVLAWGFSRSITGPLRAVVAGARAFGAGRLDQRIAVKGRDEVGELAVSFNQMAADVTALYDDLSRERRTLAAIQDSMSEGLVVLDSQDVVVYCNRAAYKVWGIPEGAATGRRFTTMIEESIESFRAPGSAEAVRRLVGNGWDGRPNISEIHVNDGRTVLILAFPIPLDDDRRLIGLLLRDVTLERDLEQRRDAFVSIASHELRTPMTTIAGFSELLLTRSVSEDVRHKWTEYIHRDVLRLSAIVEDMLNVSRIQSGKLTVRPEPVDVSEVVEKVFSGLRVSSAIHTFQMDIPSGFPLLQADTEKLEQVLVNLVSNAIKYSPEGGAITVRGSMSPHDDKATISVRDQGIGIAPEDQGILFTMFQRVERAETRGIRGTGLGLYIVKGLVEIMGGTVWVESEVGRGSTFLFSLPVAPTASD